jgi:hypothetical protein
MTGFISVRLVKSEWNQLVNVSQIAQVKRGDRGGTCVLDLGPRGDLIVNHTYDDVVQLMLKTDCVAIGR